MAAEIGDNHPPILVEMTPDLAEFVEKNCAANIALGLGALQRGQRRAAAEELVDMIERFKALQAAVRKARA